MIRTDYSNVDAVVFDFGGVISVSPMPKWEHTLYPYCESFGLAREAVRAGFTKYRSLWDGDSITFEAMYRRIFADAGLPEPTEQVLAGIRARDAASWVDELRPDTLALMQSLKADGKKLAILSNMSSDFFTDYFETRCAAYRALVDVEVISGHERLCKPAPEIYARAEQRLGVSGSRILFYDDFEHNVVAARDFGWQAELYPPPEGRCA